MAFGARAQADCGPVLRSFDFPSASRLPNLPAATPWLLIDRGSRPNRRRHGNCAGSCGVRHVVLNLKLEGFPMTKFVRCVGVDHITYHVNVEQIAWMFRPAGARHTVIRFSGAADALSVLETPHEITSHAHSGEHAQHSGMESPSGAPRTRTMAGQRGARTPPSVGTLE